MLRDGRTAGRMLPFSSAPNAYWRHRRMQAQVNRLGPQSPVHPMQIGVSPATVGDRSLFRRIFGLIWRKVN